MKSASSIFAIILSLSIIAGSAYIIADRFGWLAERRAPNVLVVSVCSLRPDRIGTYNSQFKRSPKIDKWAKNSFVFTNAIAEKPWQNFTYEGQEFITDLLLDENGYTLPRRDGGYRFIIPPTKKEGKDDEWYWSEDAILHYQESLAELKAFLTKKRNAPTYVFAHLKYMHYPYYDPINMNEQDWAKLSAKSHELMKKYTKTPQAYDAQLPVVEVLLNNFDLLKKKFGVNSKILSAAGVISDPGLTERWRQTPGFNDDVQMIREMYDLKMEKFDDMAAEVLNLFGDEELKKNTVVIFTGDHGEALMDHGVIGHSVNVYEEMLRYPLMVKFPGKARGKVISQQVNHYSVAQIVEGIIDGSITQRNFAAKAQEFGSDHVIARNCQDTIRTVRYRSEWKYIKNMASGKSELYNLKSDPGEKENLAESNYQMAWQLEEWLLSHDADFKRLSSREAGARVCMNQ